MKPVTQPLEETARLTHMFAQLNLISPESFSALRIAAVVTLFFALSAFSFESIAQQKAAPSKSTSKRTTINFEDQLVEGQAQKPELFYLLQQRNNNFKRLIRLRENFIPEMRKSSEDVGRPGGSKGSEG